MPSNTSRKSRKAKRARREPGYIACLLANGPKPTNFMEAQRYKEEVIEWWMSTIVSTPQPKGNASGHRFYTRFMSWYHSDGKAYLTTVVKETDE